MHDDQDYEWRLRWWLADTLRPYAEIAMSGLAAALIGGIAARDPALLAAAIIGIATAAWLAGR